MYKRQAAGSLGNEIQKINLFLIEVVGVVGHRLPINAGKDVVGCARILNNQAFLQIFSRKQADFVCVDEFVDQNV